MLRDKPQVSSSKKNPMSKPTKKPSGNTQKNKGRKGNQGGIPKGKR